MVIVTGGAGFIGSVLVRELLREGYRVKVLDKLLFGAAGLTDLPAKAIIQKDIRTVTAADLLDDDGQPAEAVIHLAGMSNDPTSEFAPGATWEINVGGTDRVLRAVRDAGVPRFIFASSASIYDLGMEESEKALCEEDHVAPTATYSRSKLAAEAIVRDVSAGDPTVCCTILRKGTVYGWSPRMRFDLVVNQMTMNGLRDGKIQVYGDGSIWRPMVSITDAARAYLAVLRAPAAAVRGQTFNVVEKNYQVRELAIHVQEAICIPIGHRRPPGPLRNYQVDGQKLRGVLGWKPLDKAMIGAAEIADGLRDHPTCMQGLELTRASNIQWLQHLVEMEQALREMRGVL